LPPVGGGVNIPGMKNTDIISNLQMLADLFGVYILSHFKKAVLPTCDCETYKEFENILFEKEKEHRLETNAVASDFIYGVDRKRVSPWVRYFLMHRVACAHEFCRQLIDQERAGLMVLPGLAGVETKRIWIEWLLLNLWEQRSFHWLKLLALALCGESDFYDLTNPSVTKQTLTGR